ncbi:hypothetical protein SCP_0204490 [Sparassis crispa]|uniref:F-box domain-containing protein n=1 Tax=Sparassis crispa TaxID=139825 RepID=A0A401GAR4_9APHY|nr:hypothetical protein SCP_0204490 [Sparassis crispa]GBE79252.1 hypothetical protein SCP_0204490 [Sparassis crispa]
MSLLAVLPAELLDAICEPLSGHSSSLAALARTCAALAPSATRVLYCSISVNAYARTLPAVLTLAARPSLAALVRCFSIILDDSTELPLFPAYYVQLRTALAYMHNLSHLDVLVPALASWVLAPPGSQPSPIYTHLEYFACAFPLDSCTSAFLARTPALRALQLSASPSPTPVLLPSTYIPLLSSYTGPASLLPLLSSRPLTALHLAGDLASEDVFSQAEASLAEDEHGPAGARVQVLSAITSGAPAEFLAALARAYPALVCLRVMTTCAFWDTPDMTCYTRIASILASLPNLAAFELSGMHWEARPKASSPGPEKEWISPPVTPRTAHELAADPALAVEGRESELAAEFAAWGYY